MLSGAGTLTLQTWGFGGGTNAAGMVIPAGGFDPFVGVFDSSGDLIQGTSDVLSSYASFTGCPPAGLVTIGNVPSNVATLRCLSSWRQAPIPSYSRMPATFQTPPSTALPTAI
jgi:hypothetical protein